MGLMLFFIKALQNHPLYILRVYIVRINISIMKFAYTIANGLKYSLCFCCNDFGILRQVWIFYSRLNTPIDFYRHFPPRCAWHPEQHTAVWIIWGWFCPAGNLNELLISRDEHHIDFVILGVSTFSRCTSHRDFNFPRLKLLRVSLRAV